MGPLIPLFDCPSVARGSPHIVCCCLAIEQYEAKNGCTKPDDGTVVDAGKKQGGREERHPIRCHDPSFTCAKSRFCAETIEVCTEVCTPQTPCATRLFVKVCNMCRLFQVLFIFSEKRIL